MKKPHPKRYSGTDYQLHVIDLIQPNAIMIYVELGDKPSDIAKQLEEKDIIETTLILSFYQKSMVFMAPIYQVTILLVKI